MFQFSQTDAPDVFFADCAFATRSCALSRDSKTVPEIIRCDLYDKGNDSNETSTRICVSRQVRTLKQLWKQASIYTTTRLEVFDAC